MFFVLKKLPFSLRVWHTFFTVCFVVASLLGLLLAGFVIVLYGWILPNLDSIQPRLVSWVSQTAQANLSVGSIQAQGNGIFPSFDLRDLVISAQAQDASDHEKIQIERLQFSVSPWGLLQRRLDQLVIDAPVIDAVRDLNGQIRVAGFKSQSKKEPSPALDWLMSQPAAVVNNGVVHWTDIALQQPKASFTAISVQLHQRLQTHSLAVRVSPPSHWGQPIQVIGKIHQAILERHPGRWQTWSGQLYAELQSPQLVPFISAISAKPSPQLMMGAQLLSDSARLQGWFNFSNAALNSASLLILQTPEFVNRLQIDYDLNQRDLRVFGTALQTEKLTQAATALWPTMPSPVLALANRGVVDQFQLDVKKLASAQFKASFRNADLTGSIQGSWLGSAKGAGSVDLTAQMAKFDLTAAHRYLPASISAANRAYLQEALVAGSATDLRLKYRGEIEKIDLNRLRLTGALEHIRLAFAPKWPYLSNTQAQFELSQSALSIKNFETDFAGLPVKGALQIDDIRNPVLHFHTGTTTTTLASVLNLADQLPINASFLKRSQSTGSIDIKAEGVAPLANLKASRYRVWAGLQNSSFSTPEFPLISDLKGMLSWSETGLALQDFSAQWLGGSIQLSGPEGQIQGRGVARVAALQAWQPQWDFLLSKASGELAYQLAFNPNSAQQSHKETSDSTPLLRINSDLKGLALDLPEPFVKPVDAAWPFQLQLLPGQQLKFALGNQLDGHLQQKAGHWSGQIAIGHPAIAPSAEQSGVGLSIQLPKLDVSAWQSLLASRPPSSLEATTPPPQSLAATSASPPTSQATFTPTQFLAQIQDLVWKNRHFENVVLGASRTVSTLDKDAALWRINTSAKEFNGYAEFRPANPNRQAQLYARLARLTIPDSNSKTSIEKILEAPETNLPDLDIVINELEVLGKSLGQLEVVAKNQPSLASSGASPHISQKGEWALEKLSLTNPAAQMNASGVWSAQPLKTEPSRVNLKFNWAIDNAGDLLASLGLPETVKDGKGLLQGQVAWQGTPLALHYPSLAGQIDLDLKEGQFLKIDPGLGRLVSVLSLQALPRRLAFNFSDVFSEGFSFDDITGQASIQKGILETSNLQMNSVLAKVSLNGTADIANETQNLKVRVVPDINAGGASLLATIVNPVLGAVTYVIQWLLGRPASAAATKAYKIEGSWRAPVVTPVPP